MKLTIISHTEHYIDQNGQVVGLASTVNEINHLLDIFDEIFHVAMLHKTEPPQNVMPYVSERITFVPIPVVGGRAMGQKLNIIIKAPTILKVISKTLKKTDVFQFRAPTGIGVFVIPYLMMKQKANGWFKYAGNWRQKNAPLAYAFQRWLLIHQNRFVTINGSWPDQQAHCLTFENPCLSQKDLKIGAIVARQKSFSAQLTLCFVGRLEEQKGVDLIIEALEQLDAHQMNRINEIHFVGDGAAMDRYKDLTSKSELNYIFHGFLSREKVHEIYKISHIFMLPSKSEGFPKVIAEALNYGCIPIVSDVSAIGHYIKHEENGYLINPEKPNQFYHAIQKMLERSHKDYQRLLLERESCVKSFTFDHYNARILKEILNTYHEI